MIWSEASSLAGTSLFLAVKNNLGPKAPGRGYRIATKEISHGIVAPFIQWDDAPVDYTADQAIAANSAVDRGESTLEKAKDFLKERLRDGPADVDAVKAEAEDQKISERTLARANKELGVKSEKDGFDGGWSWKL